MRLMRQAAGPECIHSRRVPWRSLLALAAAALAAASLGEAAWIQAKAQLGQHLIARAWARTQRGEEAPRAWPWADTRPVARLEVPAHGVNLLVLEGGTGHSLAWGPGHLSGTAPVGAPSGNAVVAGHRDTHFSFLGRLSAGDEIRVEDAEGERRAYRVTHSYVTHDGDAEAIRTTRHGRLTLVTCWPFDALLPGGSERYVVVAEASSAG